MSGVGWLDATLWLLGACCAVLTGWVVIGLLVADRLRPGLVVRVMRPALLVLGAAVLWPFTWWSARRADRRPRA